MRQDIHCIVNDCHYWSQGNKCSAQKILVTTEQFGNQNPDNVDAEMAAELTPERAGDAISTCCKTYVAKGSGNTRADGVNKLT